MNKDALSQSVTKDLWMAAISDPIVQLAALSTGEEVRHEERTADACNDKKTIADVIRRVVSELLGSLREEE